MSKSHDTRKRPARVAEPVQVYLAAADRQRLVRLAAQLDATKSDVLRKGLEALERQLTDPATHPALGMLGLADDSPEPGPGYDVAREHDRFLAESEAASWPPRRRTKRGR
jgi:hypothetical protein